MTTLPRLYPSMSLTPRAIQIVTVARIGVYNCLYVALAEREACELVAADARLINSLQQTFPFIIALASLP